MKIYIAGKIAGDRRYRAKFREAAKALEAAGHVVLNPATLPGRAWPTGTICGSRWPCWRRRTWPCSSRTTRRAGAPW